LNIGHQHDGKIRTLKGAVYRRAETLLLICEHDVAYLERLNGIVLELNEQLTQSQRHLVQANRELRRNERRIRQLMLSDPLTGLANRRHLDNRIKEEISRSHRYGMPLALAIVDIDYFKRINDQHGHDQGDQLLVYFAHRLQENLRKSDFVARYGGEEFVVLLPETSLDQGFWVMEKIRQTLGDTIPEPLDQPLTASFGIASLTLEDCQQSLLRKADKALYAAKQQGRNRISCAPLDTLD
jgi:diguanylate cyclase (GGDEF)-like protein